MNDQVTGTPAWRGRKLRRLLSWAAAIAGGIAVIGFLVLPPVVKSLLTRALAQELRREVAIEAVAINPFALTATVRGLAVRAADGAGDTLSLTEIHANLEAASIFHRGLVLSELRIVKPQLRLVRLAATRLDVSDIVEAFLARPAGEPLRFSIANLQLLDGALSVDDRVVGRTHRLTDLRLGVPFVSNLAVHADVFVEPAFEARLDGAPLGVGGRARPFDASREAAFEFDLEAVDLTRWMDYLPLRLGFTVAAARLDARLQLAFRQPQGQPPELKLGGELTLAGVDLRQAGDAPLAKWSRLAVTVRPSRILQGELALAALSIEGAQLDLRRDADGKINLMAIVPATGGATGPAGPPPAPPRISLEEGRIAGAVLRWTDERVQPRLAARIDALDATVSKLSTEGGGSAQIQLVARGGNGETLEVEARTTFAPLAAEGRLKLAGVSPVPYRAYYGEALPIDIERASLAASTAFAIGAGNAGLDLRLRGLEAQLADLRLRHREGKAEFFRLETLAVKRAEFDLAGRRLALAELAARNGQVTAVRRQDGVLDLAALAPPPSAPATPPAPPWSLSVGRLMLDGWGVKLEDRSASVPVAINVERIRLSAENLASAGEGRASFDLAAGLGRRGRIAAAGTLRTAPLALSARLDAGDIELLPLQPYFTERLNVALTRGEVSAKGTVDLALSGSAAPRAAFKGEVAVADLHTVDKVDAGDLLAWKSLRLNGVDAATAPLAVHVGGIALADFYARIAIGPEGRVNLQDMVRGEATEALAAPGAPAAALPPVSVGGITLSGGRVDFSDRFIKPNYSARLVGLGGQVGELSSGAAEPAALEISGRLDGGAPLTLSGRINPLAAELFLDIAAKVRDIELAPLTPYSGKYAGYAIEKGKLSLDVAYRIENRKLQAANKLFLDQLTFGEPVDSPDATKLPVLLAVALLKNGRGEIDINLPIAGSLDDPEFSFGGIIAKAVLNLIVKAVTAPFALLGSLFGGGEELAYLEFDPGRSAIGADGAKKLASLAKALNDRPALKLEVAGRIDPASDREALRRVMLERRVKAQKLAETVQKGEEQGAVDEVAVSAQDYPRYLELAYKAAQFDKPRNLVGLTKSLPVEEMERLLLANLAVGDEDLRQLAERRAQNAKAWLVTEGKVDPARVFILAPRLETADAAPKASPSRADFSLR